MTLAVRVARGVVWMAGGEVARQATQFVVVVILARLVAPVDFGLLAMATFMTEVSSVMRNWPAISVGRTTLAALFVTAVSSITRESSHA